MKKLIYSLSLTVAMTLALFSSSANAATEVAKDPAKLEETMTAEQKEAKIRQIKQRVEEIKAMDKSHLSKQERKELKKEVREMKKQANAIGAGGVYLSVGAIIIIILLLILIL
ncbi:hypothetical protein B0I27_10466 [Arcticibacter pallidicorallinus]|uniref:Seryl-tRNA synthetase n=1 Tax=Arcticibacter pallidicorallinus TaxID=1259464 RepID=A0A2T0U562_9SPHI|nr:hypothetical protein [Arcticibacter pallidicorallinus]PRY53059.1 hypothetical protein B0I27_10466 [Arcticibacter pallidicorallinus]